MKSRKEKCNTEMENGVEEDLFYSKLPEPHLRSHILSFLPTKDAVRTSICGICIFFLTQSKEDVYPVSTLHVFANLSHLELGLVTIEFIFGLLQKSPVLKTLVLALKETPTFSKELLTLAVVPDCLKSALQIVNFEKVNGDEQELFFAEFVLKYSKMLERMSFSLINQKLAKSMAMKEFKEKLYSFKKGHSFGYLEFSYD
ncbi:hypothetical protein QL285_079744 [Trifolium repens]|nr:hypothetical protein QL285_079744 [Trifolium repens]